MHLLELTLDTPAENLALDEALWLQAERSPDAPDVLRLWESPVPFVVLGRSGSCRDEVHHEYCRGEGIPVLRRCSGGGTVLAGPGCLMYAVVLPYAGREPLRKLDQAHRFVMTRVRQAVLQAGVECTVEGISDLALNGRKVGGNALRCGRNAFLYHGTLLCGMAPDLIASCLRSPARQPEWRLGREHREFVGRIPLDSRSLAAALAEVWEAGQVAEGPDRALVRELVSSRYGRPEWNEQTGAGS